MTNKERAKYYHELYKVAATLMFMVADPTDEVIENEEHLTNEGFARLSHMTLCHTMIGVADLLAGLVEEYSDKADNEIKDTDYVGNV